MKNIIPQILILLVLFTTSCEDVIDVNLQDGSSRLVVEASLDWEKGTTGNEQTILLSESSPYFADNLNRPVTGANVQVTNNVTGDVFTFEDQNNGAYVTNSFGFIIGNTYALRVEYNGEVYTAEDTLNAVPDITDLHQSTEEGFDEEAFEVNFTFIDPAEEGDNYLFRFQRRGDVLADFEYAEDKFVNGNSIDWWFEKEEEEDEGITEYIVGETVDIGFFSISRSYYDYIKIIIDQMGGFDFFSTTPISVKGNCINETNPDNYALGYFRLTEVVKTSYTFVED